jgi:hypothetical protein
VRTASAAAFQLTIAIGAFLLFLIEPMAARFLLPWFGGSPSVWSTCLLFFQAALLGGYVYAHITRRLGPGRQARLHLVLLATALLTLPIIPSPAWKPTDPSHPAGKILLLLAATVGLPYVLLAATAPMVQDWFARLAVHDEIQAKPRHSVYWLYALSNLGSLLGLLAYPTSIERLLSIRGQAWFWSGGFVLFSLVCVWTALQVWRLPAPAVTAAELARDDAPIAPGDWAMWIVLSLAGTGLLLAVTNELCQNVAVVPLLWIVPLTAYLLTFILCFSGMYRRSLWIWVLLGALGFLSWLLRQNVSEPFAMQVGALLAVLFSGCMVCHGELVHIRPAPRHLTAFYLAVAGGGSIGGIAVALVAPIAFSRLWEFQIFTLLPLALLIVAIARDRGSRLHRGWWRLGWALIVAGLCVSTYELVRRPEADGSTEVARRRNFYGVLTVLDDDPGQEPVLRRLRNGQILHGAQFADPAHKMDVTTYYGEGSGVELAINQHPKRHEKLPLRIGVIGLGAGTIAALGHAGDTVHFYEINPTAVDFAQQYFSFLSGTPATVEITLGDARLSLERELRDPSRQHTYDVLAIDAFSGDAIPVHLLTREAFALYRAALCEDGVLAVHVSNHYLDLPPIVRGLAAEQERAVALIETNDDESRALDSSTWMLVTNNAAMLANAEPYASKPEAGERSLIWTDAFSSLLQVLKK